MSGPLVTPFYEQNMKCSNCFVQLRTELRRRLVFCARNSNISGLQHVLQSRSASVKWLWIAVLAASAGCMAVLLAPARAGSPSYMLDTRYLSWTTTFPAVTVCENYNAKTAQKKFNSSQFGDLLRNISNDYDYQRYLTNLLYAVLGSCKKEFCEPCGSTVPCDMPWRQIIDQIHWSCAELLSGCSFNGAAFPCCARFRAVDAEAGPCYSFNTLQHKNATHESLMTVNRTTGPGLLTFRLQYDANIAIHSSEELSTNNLDNKFKFEVKTYQENWVEFLFSLVEMVNDPLLKFEQLDVRGCRDLGEVPQSPLHTYPVYSYGACKLAQSTDDVFSECGCVHPARDHTYKEHYCNYTGLHCLRNYATSKNKLGIDKKKNHEPCMPSCSERELTTIHISKKWVGKDTEDGTMVNIRMSSLPHLRYTRHLFRSNLDLVVSIGGVVGLLFGASILSLVEVFYLILRNP